MKSSVKELIKTDLAFSELSIKKGAAYAFREFLTKDAIMLPQNGKPIFGIHEIFKSISQSSKNGILSWIPQNGKVSYSNDLGYTWGIYKLQLKDGLIIEGKYLNVWVKQKEGSWKVEIDMGNTNSK